MLNVCLDCGVEIAAGVEDGLCDFCREMQLSPSLVAAGIKRVKPMRRGVPCIVRSPETGRFIDLTTGRVEQCREAFYTKKEKALLAQK